MKARHRIQLFFFVWIMLGAFVLRRNIEAWCPMGGMEALYRYLTGGTMLCSLAITNFFMLIGVLLLALAFKRVFCGYLCPLGAVAEGMRVIAGKVKFRQFRIPRTADRILCFLKYAVLIAVLGWTWKAAELVIRVADPCYALITTGEEAVWTTYLSLVVFVVSAFFISMPFCRWLCPVAAAMNITSFLGLTRIVRNPAACTDCGVCSKVCPMNIDVASKEQVRTPECIGCMECVQRCPQTKANPLQWKLFGRRAIARPQMTILAAICVCLLSVYAAAWLIPLPTYRYEREGSVPEESAVSHFRVQGIECAGSAMLFIHFLERQDFNQIPGYLKVTTSPASGFVDVAITYDPAQTDETSIRDAIVEPYYDEEDERWRFSPFKIEGYDPLEALTEVISE
jgi:polyferredoxin